MTKKPQWRRYSGLLNRSLIIDQTFVEQIDQRMSELCGLLGVLHGGPDWERHLLAVLVVRHVPGFQTRKLREPQNFDAELIELVDAIKADHKKRKGKPPSTEAVVRKISKDDNPDNPWFNKTPARLLRIYNDQKVIWKKTDQRVTDSIKDLVAFIDAKAAVEGEKQNSHSRLIWEITMARSRP